MKKKVAHILFFIFLNLAYSTYGQSVDTLTLEEITVHSYFKDRPFLRAPASVAIIDTGIFTRMPGASLVPVLNTVSGVRMEERSPGSYRLSIRGSLLRSPFGVRNVKVYLDEFPLTDAGGNTFLNLLDGNLIKRVEILKGPDGSLFGANSGGVVRITPVLLNSPPLQLGTAVNAGSFGLFQQNATLQLPFRKSILALSEASFHSDGYRVNSSLNRQYFQGAGRWGYHSRGQIQWFLFYADLNYLTPGGLTLSEWQTDPRAARPSTSTLPGAVAQHAGVSNQTFFGGVLHEFKINRNLRQVTALFGSHTDFENPYINNIEERNQTNRGLRTWFEASNGKEGLIHLTFHFGIEAQQSSMKIANYGNRNGSKDTVQVSDHLKAVQRFGFIRLSADFYNRLTVEASASINDNRFIFSGIQPFQTPERNREFKTQVMPRMVMSYLISDWFALRGVMSRGYSPPTFDEIRSSDNRINTSLQPEQGWNYEAGTRIHDHKDFIWLDMAIFYFRLQQAIVRQINQAGQEYFVNAGITNQPGLESQLTLNILHERSHHFVRKIQLTNSFTWSDFKFKMYLKDGVNNSGNELTGVPQNILISGLEVKFPSDLFITVRHNYTSRIALNDANSLYAGSFHLIDLKTGWMVPGKFMKCQLYFGINNVLNQKYSLGNDLNAFGGRYYNPAPAVNFYAGMRLDFSALQ